MDMDKNVVHKSMPPIGLGTSKDNPTLIGGAVKAALEAGYRMIDTATFYSNEVQIGQVLREAFKDGVVTREELYIITKLPPIGARRVRHFLRKSLTELGLDYVDLYLIHNPVSFLYGKDDNDLLPYVDGKFAFDMDIHYLDIWKDMEKCVEDGLCREIGLSNFNAQQVEEVYRNAKIKPANLQGECHLYLQEHHLVDLCKRKGMTFTAFAPLGSPDYSRFQKVHYGVDRVLANILEDDLLVSLAEKYNKTPAQIFDFTLTDDEMEQLKKADKNQRLFNYKIISPGIENHPFYPFN